MEKRKEQSHLWSIVIVAVVMGAYVLSGFFNGPAVTQVGVTYRARSGVVLQCMLDWQASGLPSLISTADHLGVPVSFFASIDWLEENGEENLLGKHSIGLMLSGDPAGYAAQVQRAKELLGDKLTGLTVANAQNRAELSRTAEKSGLKAVFCTYELRNSTVDPAALIKRVENETFDGAIIRFDPAKTTVQAFSRIVETLKAKGYAIVDINDTK